LKPPRSSRFLGWSAPSALGQLPLSQHLPRGNAVARIQHPAASLDEAITREGFVELQEKQNQTLGIWELDQKHKKLQAELIAIQDQLVDGKVVDLPTWWNAQ
jgi:hypothetical protein